MDVLTRQLIWAVTVAIAGAGFVTAAVLHGILPGRGLYAEVLSASLGLLTAVFTAGLLRALEFGLLPGVERDWGGLGGDAGGWRMSPALVYFLGACLFGVLTVISFVAADFRGPPPEAGTKTNAPASNPADASKSSASKNPSYAPRWP